MRLTTQKDMLQNNLRSQVHSLTFGASNQQMEMVQLCLCDVCIISCRIQEDNIAPVCIQEWSLTLVVRGKLEHVWSV